MRALAFKLIALPFSVGLAVLISEAALRIAAPPVTRFYAWPPNLVRVFHPNLSLIHGIGGSARFTVNSLGMRGREPDPDDRREYRILAIGGSTTECLYLDDTKAWPSLIETMLGRTADGRRVWVGNVGESGMNSRDHVMHVKYLTIQPPRIDMIVVLVGINDLTVALAQDDHYVPPPPITEPEASRIQLRRAFSLVPGRLHEAATDHLATLDAPWYKKTATYQLLKRARRGLRTWFGARGLVQDEGGGTLQTWRDHRRKARRILDRLPDLKPAFSEYRQNLDMIVDLAWTRKIRVLLMTQPVIWHGELPESDQAPLWLGGVGDFQVEEGHEYYSVRALSEAMLAFNRTLLEVCRARAVGCLDLAAAVPRNWSMFYDDAHFTERGAEFVASQVTKYLSRLKPFSARETNGQTGQNGGG